MVHDNLDLWTTVGPFSDKVVDAIQDFVLPQVNSSARLKVYVDGVKHAVPSGDIVNLLSLVDSNRQLLQVARVQSLSRHACTNIKDIFSTGPAFQALRILYLETHRHVAWKQVTLLAPNATSIRLSGMRSAPSFSLCTELSELCIEDVGEIPEDAIVVVSALRLRRLYLNVRSMQQALDTAASKLVKLTLPCLKVATVIVRCSDLYRLFALCPADGLSSLTNLSLHGLRGVGHPVHSIEDHVIQRGLQALIATFRNMIALSTFDPSHLLDIDSQNNHLDLSLMSVLRYISQERRAKLSMDTRHCHPDNVNVHASAMEGILAAIAPLHVDKRLHVGLTSLSTHPFERDPIGGLSSMGVMTTLRLSGDIKRVEDMLKTLAHGRGEPVSLRTHMILDGWALTRHTLTHLRGLASRSGNRIKLTIVGQVEDACKAALAGQHRLQVEYKDT
ncbi:unnamed protein product [Peniophora sp. CBMAI 1063]|nr:unnamed protein product [Peniophora sp. CBMAI 1063]